MKLKSMREKGFEPSNELIDKALNLAPLTTWLPPQIYNNSASTFDLV